MLQFFDAARVTSRRRTPEGMLLARATITRAGTVSYLASELGISGAGRVKVERTLDSIKHPDTLASASAATITIRHPPANQVNPANFRSESVGHIVGTPTVTAGGEIVADILIGDEAAIKFLETEGDEVSIGYAADMEPVADGLYRTKGPLRINHLAIVPKGRAGATVRVHDADPEGDGAPVLTPAVDRSHNQTHPTPKPGSTGEKTMDLAQIQALIDAAVTNAIAGLKPAGQNGPALDEAKVSAIVTDALKPALEPIQAAVKEVKTAQDEAKDAAETAEANRKAKQAMDEFEARIRAEERQRARVLGDAAVLMGPEEVAKLGDQADIKTICTAALGDAMSSLPSDDPACLMGAVAMRAADARRAQTGGRGALPAGIVPAPTVTDAEKSVEDARKEAMDAQRKMFEQPIGDGGGMTASISKLHKTG